MLQASATLKPGGAFVNPEPLSAPRTIVSPRLPFTMPTRQLIPPTLCTRSHEGLQNEPNFTGRCCNTPTKIINETEPIPSDQHRRPLTLHTRQHENTKRTQFRPQPIANKTHLPPQANPIPSQPYSHAAPLSPSPFAPLVILAFPMLRVRFAPSPTGLLHMGLEVLGRETCLRCVQPAIGKLKTS